MRPDVSVIVPIYKTEKYLERCLESIVSQTLQNIEILCIDDCSPDNSCEIVQKFAQADPRVKLISHKKNLGLGGARNTGIRAAKADYIASIDSDDYVTPTMMEALLTATNHGKIDIVVCGFEKVSDDGNLISQHVYQADEIANVDNNIDIFSIMTPSFWNKLWRKSLFIDHNIEFPEHMFYEDLATTPIILTKAKTIKFTKPAHYKYVIREQSIMTSYSAKHITDYFLVFDILKTYLAQNDLYKHYEFEFDKMINANLKYHCDYVKKSDMGENELRHYLKQILLLKAAFLDWDNKFGNLDTPSLLQHIGHFSPKENHLQINTAFNLYRSLSRPFLRKKERRELRDHPTHFLKKSNHPVAIMGKYLFNVYH